MKKSVLLSIIGVLLVIGVGITFAYFSSGVEVSGEGSTVELEPGDMIKVTYDAGDSSLNSTNLIPGDTVSKSFTVTVTPTKTEKTAVYAIYLDLTNNTFVKCDDSNYNSITNACIKDYEELTYTIKDGDNVLATGDLTGQTGKIKLLTESKTVDSETTFTYTLEITFKETNADQNHNMEKVMNGNIKVEFSFETMQEQIENLYTDNSTILAYDNTADNNLRYIGANPNNYVLFNNELWRIIGVFNNIDNGTGTKETRLKIIRDEPYSTGMTWDTDNVNDWTTASLQEELNTTYLNSIQSPYKAMISNAKWNLGGTANFTSSSNGLTSHFYGYERGTTVYSGRPTEWTGQIGLMYPSDYGYATSGGSTMNRDMCLTTELWSWNNLNDCYSNDWLYQGGPDDQWALTPFSGDSSNVIRVNSSGSVYRSYTTNESYVVFPALYLSSNAKITDGDGSHDKPFTLSL